MTHQAADDRTSNFWSKYDRYITQGIAILGLIFALVSLIQESPQVLRMIRGVIR